MLFVLTSEFCEDEATVWTSNQRFAWRTNGC